MERRGQVPPHTLHAIKRDGDRRNHGISHPLQCDNQWAASRHARVRCASIGRYRRVIATRANARLTAKRSGKAQSDDDANGCHPHPTHRAIRRALRVMRGQRGNHHHATDHQREEHPAGHRGTRVEERAHGFAPSSVGAQSLGEQLPHALEFRATQSVIVDELRKEAFGGPLKNRVLDARDGAATGRFRFHSGEVPIGAPLGLVPHVALVLEGLQGGQHRGVGERFVQLVLDLSDVADPSLQRTLITASSRGGK